jgi:hypothetical protein
VKYLKEKGRPSLRENVCNTALAFICLKVGIRLEIKACRKVRNKLPLLKELKNRKFIQKT